MALYMQIFATGIICSLCVCTGIIFTWPSSTLRLFESANTTLHRPMTETELALFGSLSSIGALISTPFAGVTLNRIGRKPLSILVSLMGVISWAMIAVTNRVEVLLCAVFVTGLSGSSFLVVTVFVSEICQDFIRGAVSCGTMIFYGVGMLLSYGLGGFLNYYTMIYVCLTMSTVSTIALFMLRESPICLMIKGMEKEAAQSLAYYRSVKPDSKEVLEELNIIRRSLNPEMDDMTPEEEKQLKPDEQTPEKLPLWKFIKKSSSTRSAIYLTLTLMTASIFQGLVVVQVYADPLFEEAIPSMSSTVCSIVLAVVAVVAGLVGAYLTEVAGRRPLMIYASFATGACCLLLGLQLHLHWGPHWLIAVTIYLFTTTYSLGGGTVPYVLIAEVFLPEVKSFMSMMVVEWAWLCNSVILFIFNPLLKAIGLGPVFYLFAGISVLTGIYCIICMPETKGLNIDQIQEKLSKKKRNSGKVFK